MMKSNQLIHNSLGSVNKAVERLSSDDITVIGFYHDSLTKPTIEIEHHPKCEKFIAIGRAAYYRHEGLYRFGQFELDGCRVVWKERDTRHLH